LADRIVRAEYVAYEPELNRYGGRAGVDLAERHFCASSTAAVLALSEFEDAPRATRLGRALAAMLATMHVFFALPDEVAPFAASYARGYFDLVAQQYTSTREWQRQFDAAWQTQAESIGPLVLALWRGLCAGEAISPFLDSYRASLNATQAVFEDLSARGLLDVPNDRPEDAVYLIAARRIVPSYVHMMNNRLGISTAEEALLGRRIAHSIERVASEAA
jgi:thiopeptide-type bacteriocin biosynthesis protein